MPQQILATMVTTTSYGTWLPGDLRSYVYDGVILPPNPKLLDHARSLLAQAPVYFTDAEQITLAHALQMAAGEFAYNLTDLGLDSWHLHWIIEHGDDPVPTMVGRLKTRMRQALARGRIWTEGYCHRCLHSPADIATARGYISRHSGCRIIDGRPVDPAITDDHNRSPGRAGG